MEVQDQLNREPQTASWPGERVVVWSYSGSPTLVEVLERLRGDEDFSNDDLVVTDFGASSDFSVFNAVSAGQLRVRDLPFEHREGVALLTLPRDFARAHPLALRKLLWLIPYDSIYLVTNESVDPRNLA